jgi:hypothetical protein
LGTVAGAGPTLAYPQIRAMPYFDANRRRTASTATSGSKVRPGRGAGVLVTEARRDLALIALTDNATLAATGWPHETRERLIDCGSLARRRCSSTFVRW